MDYVIYDNKNLQTFEIEQTAISNGSLIGTCELGKAEIQLLNDNNEYSSYKNKWIRTDFGSFFVNSVEPVQEKVNIKLSCYDVKHLLDSEYIPFVYENLFPCTLAVWRNSIARSVGLKFNDNNNFPNANLLLETQPYIEEGSSNRDVIKIIAEAGASWVECDSNDDLYFKYVNDEENTISDWIELTTEKDKTNPINVVVLGRGDVEDNVYYPKDIPTDPSEFKINNNYILDPQDTTSDVDRREETIIPIYNQVKDLSYIPFTMRTQSVDNPLNIKLGSKIKYYDVWGNELTSIIMKKTLKWLGGNINEGSNYELSISCEEIKESSTDYQKSTPAEKLSKIGVDVDKQNKIIKLLNEQIYALTPLGTATGYPVKIEDAIKNYLYSFQITNLGHLYLHTEDGSYLATENGQYIILEDNIKNPLNKIMIRVSKYPKPNTEGGYIPTYPVDSFKDYEYDLGDIELEADDILDIAKGILIKNGETIEVPKLEIELFDGYNEITVNPDNSFIKTNVKYFNQSQMNDIFATKSYVKLANDEFKAGVIGDLGDKTVEGALDLKLEKDDTEGLISTFNLNANQVEIHSNNFTLDKTGSISAKNGKFSGEITGSTIELNNSTENDPKLSVSGVGYSPSFVTQNYVYSDGLMIKSENFSEDNIIRIGVAESSSGGNHAPSGFINVGLYNGLPLCDLQTSIGEGIIECRKMYGTKTRITFAGITTPTLTQTSLEESKKNFEKFDNALEEIKKTDIYKYNLKNENDDNKKHLGIVIGENYNYSHEITSVNEEGKEVGVDTYSMVSLCLQAIKEQQTIIEKLKEEIDRLTTERNKK